MTFYNNKTNGLSDLFSQGITASRSEETYFSNPVLTEVDDDPFGPPTVLGVLFVNINLLSLKVVLKGYRYDEDTKALDYTDFILVSASPTCFRVLTQETVR